MISIDLSGRRIPKWLGIVHGLAAASGFVWLLTHVFLKVAGAVTMKFDSQLYEDAVR